MPTRTEPKVTASKINPTEKASSVEKSTQNNALKRETGDLSTPELPSPAKPLELKNSSRLARNVILGLIAIVVVFLIVVGLGIYTFHWSNAAITKTARLLPYPIASVNYRPISYNLYTADSETLTHYYSKQQELNPSLYTMPTDNEIRSVVMTKLIKDAITDKLAKSNGITVAKADVDAEYDKVAEQSGNPAGIEQNIKELYNWDIPTFKDKVIKPYLVRSKLQEKLSQDTTINGAAKTEAEAVLARVNGGTESFEDIAKEFSQDETTSINGGDLGYFGSGEMVATFEEAVAGLEIGKISGLVQTPFGYHIIKLTEKTTDENGQPKYRASHILIKTKSVDSAIEDELKKSKIWVFPSDFHWDKDQLIVLPESATPDANTNSTDTSDTNQASGTNQDLNTNQAVDTNTDTTE
jgi:foldase protein PrsA